jgi:hypothetical protein
VEVLLAADQEYRRKAQASELRRIAAKHRAWLPIMHAERQGWDLTVLYSNTARAHDWVVIFYDRDGSEDQANVVTETSGPLEGERVVRGREAECWRYYQR